MTEIHPFHVIARVRLWRKDCADDAISATEIMSYWTNVKCQDLTPSSPLSKISYLSLFCILAICAVLCILGCKNEEPYSVVTCTDEDPAWSPDGRYIAYFHDPNDIPIVALRPILFFGCSKFNDDEGDRRPGIWVLDLETMESEFLTEGWSPDWSPDGKEIVYVNNRNIYKINIENQEITLLKREGFFPDWSPDSRKIAFSINSGDSAGLWVVDSSGSNLRSIGDWGWMVPDWNPGGYALTFVGHIDSIGGIYTTDTTGSNVHLIVEGGYSPVFLYSPVFSPDGSMIAYVSERDSKRNIYVIDTSGQNEVQLTDVEIGNAVDPAWSPDGSQIIFAQRSEIGNALSLWIMNSDGSGKRQITFPDN